MNESGLKYLLDMRTMVLIGGVISLILCFTMLHVSRSRKTYEGFSHWTAGAMLYFLGSILLGLRNILPDFFSVILANGLFLCSLAATMQGLEIFSASPRKAKQIFLASIPAMALIVFFTYHTPDVNARIVIMSVVLSLFFARGAHVARHYLPHVTKEKNQLLASFFAAESVWFLFRTFATVTLEDPIFDFMEPSTVQAFSMVVLLGGHFFTTICLLVLNLNRIEIDLHDTLEEVKTLRGIIPICSACKKIRDDRGAWKQMESYVSERSHATFSHGICPDCMHKLYPDYCSHHPSADPDIHPIDAKKRA